MTAITANTILQCFFMKIPLKQNLYEICQLTYLQQYIPDLSHPIKPIYIDNTCFTNRKTVHILKALILSVKHLNVILPQNMYLINWR